MFAASILVVEDEAELRGLLVRGLREEGFETASAATGRQALESAAERTPDAVIMDIGLPDGDGRDVCQALRAAGLEAPILFLTARDALTDRLSGFTAGGDDYVTKPFEFEEIIARLRAMLRRSGGPAETAAQIGGMTLDPVAHAVSSGETTIRLTPTEFRILAALAGRAGEVLRRREIVTTAWPAGASVSENTLDVYIRRLRRKLARLEGAPEIETVHGVGYSLE